MLTAILPTVKTLYSRLRQLSRRLLSRTWVLRADLRRIDRDYGRLIAQAKGDERERLIGEHITIRDLEAVEELESIETAQLCRRAWRYYIMAPERRLNHDGYEDEEGNWTRGWETGRWYLTRAAIASLQRQIEEAQKRRRDAWEAWAKILGGLITGLVALVSALVSLILAWGR